MSWICQNCSLENTDDVVCCSACAHVRPCLLQLTAPGGTKWRTRIGIDVNRRIYKKLFPGDEHQYIPSEEGCHPFSLKRETEGWFLNVNSDTTVAVKINAVVCIPGSDYPLQDGDVIWIASQSDNSRQIAPLTVNLVIMETEGI